MRSNIEGGHAHLWAEHLQAWLMELYPVDTFTASPNPTRWMKLVELIQFVCENGSITMEIGWNVLVMIPKVNSDTGGIGLLDVY